MNAMKMATQWNLAAKFLAASALMLGLYACNRSSEASVSAESPDEMRDDPASSQIAVTRQQFEASGMRIGDPENHTFQQKVSVNGSIEPAPDGIAEISTLIPGRVKTMNVSIGDYVKKGDVLFSIEGHEIIILQQEYKETLSSLEALKQAYDRQKVLAEEQVTSTKQLSNTESSYRSTQAVANGLYERLRMIGIDGNEVAKGHISPSISIVAPIDGNVACCGITNGEYLDVGELVFQIINTRKLRLHMNLHTRDLSDLAIGQTIYFYSPDNISKVYSASLSIIGNSMDALSKTVLCIADITSPGSYNFVSGMYVLADIITCEREAMAIPREAIIMEDDWSYVFCLSKEEEAGYVFRKVPVRLGVEAEDYIELLDSDLKDVLIQGAYNLSS